MQNIIGTGTTKFGQINSFLHKVSYNTFSKIVVQFVVVDIDPLRSRAAKGGFFLLRIHLSTEQKHTHGGK